jgi:hypothetical protein
VGDEDTDDEADADADDEGAEADDEADKGAVEEADAEVDAECADDAPLKKGEVSGDGSAPPVALALCADSPAVGGGGDAMNGCSHSEPAKRAPSKPDISTRSGVCNSLDSAATRSEATSR